MSEISELKTLVSNQNKMLQDIHFAIYGNPKAEIKGMAQTVSDHAKYIANDKKFKWIVAGSFGGSIGGLWAYIKTHLGL